MTTQLETLKHLIAAAEALMEAREDQMVTAEEWDRLRQATNTARAQIPCCWSIRVGHREICRFEGLETAAQARAVAACRDFSDQPVDLYHDRALVARYWRGIRKPTTWIPV